MVCFVVQVNYYKFFGVSDDAKKMEIRRVANNMALANHPDKCPDRDDAKCIAQRKEKMIIINEVRTENTTRKHREGSEEGERKPAPNAQLCVCSVLCVSIACVFFFSCAV